MVVSDYGIDPDLLQRHRALAVVDQVFLAIVGD